MPNYCQDLGLNVEMIERCHKEQDIILSIHHACSLTLMSTSTFKLIMNHEVLMLRKKLTDCHFGFGRIFEYNSTDVYGEVTAN